jgi:hypothetical protein
MNPRMQFGWVNDPAAVARVLASLPQPRFGPAAPHLAGSGVGKTVLLSDAAKRVTGKHLPAQQQPRGTCVSRGWSRSVDYLQCVLIAQGQPFEYRSISHAAVYGMAREIGGMLSDQDGAVGAWAAKAVAQWGTVTNDDAHDRDAGDDDLAVEWGRAGCPSAVKELARKHLVRTVSQVTSAEQARDALGNGYPVACCSDQGFTMQRDDRGRCRPEGHWSHCMMWSGYRDDRRLFLVEQSWGQNVPSGPLGDLDIPDNAFWIDWDVADRMLRQQDSFALSGYDGFPAQRLDWVL